MERTDALRSDARTLTLPKYVCVSITCLYSAMSDQGAVYADSFPFCFVGAFEGYRAFKTPFLVNLFGIFGGIQPNF